MIGRLRGNLLEKQPPELLIEVSGIGYEVQMPMSCFYELPEIGTEAIIYIHYVVREDAQLLYGFNTKKERALFREVIKANGVGPKLGLAILSGMTASQFVQSVEREDISTLVKLPGVGKKTAERLVVEMKDRLKGWGAGDLFNPATDAAPMDDGSNLISSPQSAQDEAVSALISLGYKPVQASKIVSQIAKPDMTSEALIRESLKSMI
ncbi:MULTISPECIES: Holliday junction branch migration protein RuvA [Aliivibrio]|uniref:Holliday junction branch migration complex subunit RuvA n=1 Tax=Aliivibrio finisterrensis TaxID=511998 RepID=A0A4Q5KTF2_9GAMM|nr:MULTISPECIES: Holliday junction branch migration protein RuvA [Aliivibrio]MDD9179501.1 Holliday junction branch migration protein RuvA [Aliivibrio sp. A6]RYU50957.1 Holliday junction branch migration protein RuvA [Aliivibrio finisterrensis]RYU51658.1 Holliday junction branch migration protein RuvA [Aliivibrio finisterrensis]RYU57468.1 Holliday junction branch migration protein RuvA [Aliivibrio finisterrensis]RYU63979.1 Holliday junction branch migration protein RuvA [Aliivibrio finisterrens